MNLIVVQDTHQLKSYTGILGKFLAKFYLFFLKIEIKKLIFKLRKEKIILVTGETFIQHDEVKGKVFLYNEELFKINQKKFREKILKFLEKINNLIKINLKEKSFFENLVFEVYKPQIANYLSYHYFTYFDFIEKIIKKNKIKKIYSFGESKETRIVKKLSEKYQIPIEEKKIFLLSYFYQWLEKYLFSRQINNKIRDFLKKSQVKASFDINSYEKCWLLSVDFFRHLKTLVPLYHQFLKKNEKAVFLSDILDIKENLSYFYGIKKDYLYFENFILKDEILSILKEKREMFERIYKNLKLNKNWLILQILNDYFEVVFKFILPLAFLYLKTASKAIERLEPKGIICLNNLRPMETSLLLMAKKKKILNLMVHPAVLLSKDKNAIFYADYFALMGSHIKNELKLLGYSSKKMFTVGDPQLDFLAYKKKWNKEKIYKKLGLKSKKKIILLISDRTNPMLSHEEKKLQFQKVAAAVAEIPEAQLVIKPHPTELRKNLLSELKNWQINNVLVSDNREIELFELLSITSVVIISWSMVGFEAMIMKIPVVVANFTKKNYDFIIPYTKEKGALMATNFKDLKEIINSLLNEKRTLRKKQIKNGLNLVKNYYSLPIGKASEKIYNLVHKLLN